MSNIRILMAVPAVLITLSVSAETTLTTDKDKFSYSLGLMIGERVLKQYGEVDYQILLQGIIAQHQGKDTLMDMSEAGRILSEAQEKMNEEKFAETKSKGKAFLEANAKRDGVTVTASGLQYAVITAADGAKPAATDSVTVHYRGTLLDGTEFDSSYSRNEPATFALNQVIRGWTEGVQLMNVGSKFKFAISDQLAYGERGAGNSIGPFETLVFEVELLKINN